MPDAWEYAGHTYQVFKLNARDQQKVYRWTHGLRDAMRKGALQSLSGEDLFLSVYAAFEAAWCAQNDADVERLQDLLLGTVQRQDGTIWAPIWRAGVFMYEDLAEPGSEIFLSWRALDAQIGPFFSTKAPTAKAGTSPA